MKEMRTLGRIILAGVALLVLLRYGLQVVSMVPLWFDSEEMEHLGHVFISFMLTTALAFGVIYLCILRPNFLLDRLIVKGDQEGEIGQPVTFAFRLVAVAAGLLCLFWTVAPLVQIISALVASREQEFDGFRQFFMGSYGYLNWGYVGGTVLRLAMGIYLIFGAPHFVRWQARQSVVGDSDCKHTMQTQNGGKTLS